MACPPRKQYFVYQTLRALKTMHSADIVHRDLKPANLLLNANCDLKVCDFGLARSTRSTNPGGKEAGLMTEYVATRWYRAPEIMLSFKMYTKAIEVWAVGCILAELLNGRPLFPGRDYGHQLDLILDVIGTPTLEEFYGITSRRSRDYIRALPIRKRRPFTALFPKASPEAIDFLQKTLVSVLQSPPFPVLSLSRTRCRAVRDISVRQGAYTHPSKKRIGWAFVRAPTTARPPSPQLQSRRPPFPPIS